MASRGGSRDEVMRVVMHLSWPLYRYRGVLCSFVLGGYLYIARF